MNRQELEALISRETGNTLHPSDLGRIADCVERGDDIGARLPKFAGEVAEKIAKALDRPHPLKLGQGEDA